MSSTNNIKFNTTSYDYYQNIFQTPDLYSYIGGNDEYHTYRAIGDPMILVSKEYKPLASIHFRAQQDRNINKSTIYYRHSKKEKDYQQEVASFHGLMNNNRVAFELVVTNLRKEGMISFNILENGVPINKIGALNPFQSWAVQSNACMDDARLILGGKEVINKDNTKQPLTIRENEEKEPQKKEEGVEYFIAMNPQKDCKVLCDLFQDTKWISCGQMPILLLEPVSPFLFKSNTMSATRLGRVARYRRGNSISRSPIRRRDDDDELELHSRASLRGQNNNSNDDFLEFRPRDSRSRSRSRSRDRSNHITSFSNNNNNTNHENQLDVESIQNWGQELEEANKCLLEEDETLEVAYEGSIIDDEPLPVKTKSKSTTTKQEQIILNSQVGEVIYGDKVNFNSTECTVPFDELLTTPPTRIELSINQDLEFVLESLTTVEWKDLACTLIQSILDKKYLEMITNIKPFKADECVICLTRKPNLILFPCTHEVVDDTEECFPKQGSNRMKLCPVCRAVITSHCIDNTIHNNDINSNHNMNTNHQILV